MTVTKQIIEERIEELNLARPYLNSDYYWNRLKELDFLLKIAPNKEDLISND